MYNPPMIVEKSDKGPIGYDIYSRLLKDRIIFLNGEIDDEVASSIIAQMLHLNSTSQDANIQFYIMSPGGEIPSTLAIYDIMQFVSNPVETYCIGEACSGAALLLAAGASGKRHILPSARVMIHQPWGHVVGSCSEVKLQSTEMERLKALVCQHLATHTGKNSREVEADSDRDFFMTPHEAKSYGIVDKIAPLRTASKIKNKKA